MEGAQQWQRQLVGPQQIEDADVFRQLMAHAKTLTGLEWSELDRGTPAPRKWSWFGGRDPSTPPGKIRVYLESKAEVDKLRDSLHGRTIQVGTDVISIQICSDLVDAHLGVVAGNGQGGR